MFADADLADALESLTYWEARAQGLPLYALRRRREARVMACRWRERVTAAERAVYGRGLAGALLMLACERRLPRSTRHRGRLIARRVVQAAVVTAFSVFACAVALTALAAHALL